MSRRATVVRWIKREEFEAYATYFAGIDGHYRAGRLVWDGRWTVTPSQAHVFPTIKAAREAVVGPGIEYVDAKEIR